MLETLRGSMKWKRWIEGVRYFLQMYKIFNIRTKAGKNTQRVMYLLASSYGVIDSPSTGPVL